MEKNVRTKIRAYGITVLLSRHPEVRRLKRFYTPSLHGNKFWSSSWLLMDFFKRRGLPTGLRVLDVGCGWGLTGIYCAKKHGAIVTGVDKDPDVFPYLSLHGRINRVTIEMVKRSFGGLTTKDLTPYDMLIGVDVCFWDNILNHLKRLINRAISAGVKMVLIADPGRSTFDELAEYYAGKGVGETLSWSVQRPRRLQGRILKIGSLSQTVP